MERRRNSNLLPAGKLVTVHLEGDKPMAKRIPLPLVGRRLAALTGQRAPSYRSLYVAALDGKIPAEQQVNGRWDVAAADLPHIAEAFGLSTTSPAVAA
jgi:hypothetical protein